MRNYIGALFISIQFLANAQQIPIHKGTIDTAGRRQGQWTKLFDAKWNVVEDTALAKYYRITEYLDDRPVGIVRDFYRSGVVQMEAHLIEDQPQDVFDGDGRWFRPSGKLEVIRQFENGTMVSEAFYRNDGTLWPQADREAIFAAFMQVYAVYKEQKFSEASTAFNPILADVYALFESDPASFQNVIDVIVDAADQSNDTINYKQKKAYQFEAFLETSDDFNVLNTAGLRAYDYGLKDLSFRLFNRAILLAIREGANPNLVYGLFNLASVQDEYTMYDQARINMEKALRISIVTYGEDSEQTLMILDGLAEILEDQRDFKQALVFRKRIETSMIRLYGANDERSILAAIEVINNLRRVENISLAFERAIELTKLELSSASLKFRMNLILGILYTDMLELTEAEEMLALAESQLDSTSLTFYSDKISILDNLSTIYLAQGRNVQAADVLWQAVELARMKMGWQSTTYATMLGNYAVFANNMGAYAKATECMEKAIEINSAIVGPGSLAVIEQKLNLAAMYGDVDRSEDALTLFKSILLSQDTVLLPLPARVNPANNLATLYLEMDSLDQAIDWMQRSLKLASVSTDSQDYKYLTIMTNLAVLYQLKGEVKQSVDYIQRAIEGFMNFKNSQSFNLTEDEKALFYEKIENIYLNYYFMTAKHHESVPNMVPYMYDLLLENKGLLFQSTHLMKTAIANMNHSDVQSKYQEWRRLEAELTQLIVNQKDTVDAELQKSKQELSERTDELEKYLLKTYYTSGEANNQVYGWQDVRKTLKKNEAAVEIVRFNTRSKDWTDSVWYAALILTSKNKKSPELVVFKSGNKLENESLKLFRSSIKYRLEDKMSYHAYWAPIAKHLKGIEKVYLSADGVYHSVSLDGLKNPVSGQYLIDEVQLELVSSTRDVIRAMSGEVTTSKAVLIGYPDYNTQVTFALNDSGELRTLLADSASRFFSGENIVLLPGTQAEVVSIEPILQQSGMDVSVYMGALATESQMKAVENPRILHIATHGFFLQNVEKQKGDMLLGMNKEQVADNSLLRSGLLLAHAKQAIKEGGDGVLTAMEAMNLNLDNTELVVLSACETGLGEVRNGEGVYGLQRAFQTAGAEAVLMSLWTVSDEATKFLMTAFYENWIEKQLPKRVAFRQAQLSLREKYPHPYFWAAFVLIES